MVPPPGHAITFLMAPANLLKLVRGGPIRSQAAEVAELLSDPARSQVILVTLPETTPVNEVIETADALEHDGGLRLGPVVVNAFDEGDDLPAELAAARHAVTRRCRVPQRAARPPPARGVAARRVARPRTAPPTAHRLTRPSAGTPSSELAVRLGKQE